MKLLTPVGLSGVAVIGFVGAECATALACLTAPSGRPFVLATPPAPQLAALRLDGDVLDEVLVVDRGERGLELHLHGSPAVVAALRARFPVDDGGVEERAAPGEPWLELLSSALSVEQLDLSIEQRQFDPVALIRQIDAMAGSARREAVVAALDRSRIALAHREPRRLVLAGAQNAGKSTLFNRLLLRERALAGPLPGLTRDPVRETTTLSGYPYDLVDTAGEGAAASVVDERAIAAGRALRDGATVMLVIDGSQGPSAEDRTILAAAADPVVVASKGDLPQVAWTADIRCDLRLSSIAVDAVTLRARIGEVLRTHRALPPAGPVGGFAALDRIQLAKLATLAAH